MELFIRDNRRSASQSSGASSTTMCALVRWIKEGLQGISARDTKHIIFAASTSLAAHRRAPQLDHFQEEHHDIRIKVVATDKDIEPRP